MFPVRCICSSAARECDCLETGLTVLPLRKKKGSRDNPAIVHTPLAFSLSDCILTRPSLLLRHCLYYEAALYKLSCPHLHKIPDIQKPVF